MTNHPASPVANSPVVLGGNVFGSYDMDRPRSFAVLDAFVAGGGTAIDTADIYANYLPGGKGGESETMIGDWLAQRGRRDEVQIATKGGGPMGPGFEGLGAAYIETALDASLRRLRTDYVDVYYAHVDDPATPQEEAVQALDRLVRSGKVRSLGASNFTPERFASAVDVARREGLASYSVFQANYNLMERDFEGELAAVCAQRGIGVLAYFGLAQGYLTGKYRSRADLDKGRRGAGVATYLDGKGPRVLAVMDRISADRGASLAAIALAWLRQKPGIVAPIASATDTRQVGEIVEAMTLTLNDEEMALLDAAGR